MEAWYRYLAGAALLAACGLAHAAADAEVAGVKTLAQGTPHDALFALALQQQRGLAVGTRGAIVESHDGGASWNAAGEAGDGRALFGVALGGDHQIAVGQQGLIVRRDDDGQWTEVPSGTTQRLLGVAVNGRGEGVAVGAFGTILVTRDAGRSWTPSRVDWTQHVEEAVEPHLYTAYVDDPGVLTIAGEFGLILRSTDHGASWTRLHRGEASVFALELRTDGVGYAVGQDGMVLISHDGGSRWQALQTGSKAVLLGVESSPDGRVLVTGMREALESRDGGDTWKRRTDGDFGQGWYAAVASPSGDGGRQAIAVGYMGRIVRFDH